MRNVIFADFGSQDSVERVVTESLDRNGVVDGDLRQKALGYCTEWWSQLQSGPSGPPDVASMASWLDLATKLYTEILKLSLEQAILKQRARPRSL
jgi:hypothetical protein